MTPRRAPLRRAGLALIATVVLVAVFAPLLAPYDPHALSGASLEEPSRDHLLGTNDIGEDLLSHLLFGARSSVTVAIGAATLSTVLGLAVGMVAGVGSRWVDTILMRLVDVIQAMPPLPLLILVTSMAGVSRAILVLIIGWLSWPPLARVVRGEVLAVKERGFVAACIGFGGSRTYLVRRHVLPAVAPVAVVGFVTVAGQSVLMEAGLAFLGLSDPLAVSWGVALNRALVLPGLYFTSVWVWWVLPVGAALTVTVLGFTFIGISMEPAPGALDRTR